MENRIIFFIFCILINITAFAGDVAGNGGDVIVCNSLTGKTYELLDAYEARVLEGLNLDLGAAELTELQKVEVALGRLKNIDPYNYKILSEMASKFYENAAIIPNIVLENIPDDILGFTPVGCTIEQLVVQREPLTANYKRFRVSGDLWRHLDNNQKAATILHEIIYQLAIQKGHLNSIKSRHFNALLFSGAFENFMNGKTSKEVIDYFDGFTGFKMFYRLGLIFSLKKQNTSEQNVFFGAKGEIATVYEAAKGSKVQLFGQWVSMSHKFSGPFGFDENGVCTVARLYGEPLEVYGHLLYPDYYFNDKEKDQIRIETERAFHYTDYNMDVYATEFRLNPSGVMIQATRFDDAYQSQVHVNGQKFLLRKDATVILSFGAHPYVSYLGSQFGFVVHTTMGELEVADHPYHYYNHLNFAEKGGITKLKFGTAVFHLWQNKIHIRDMEFAEPNRPKHFTSDYEQIITTNFPAGTMIIKFSEYETIHLWPTGYPKEAMVTVNSILKFQKPDGSLEDREVVGGQTISLNENGYVTKVL